MDSGVVGLVMAVQMASLLRDLLEHGHHLTVESIWDYEEISHVTLTVERVALVFYIFELFLRLYAGQWRTRF